jgi:hypothetical protein
MQELCRCVKISVYRNSNNELPLSVRAAESAARYVRLAHLTTSRDMKQELMTRGGRPEPPEPAD